MRVQCQVVTTPTSDTPGTCLLLHFDNKRYLLGHIGEGSQRACVERHVRLPRVSDIFLSGRMEWLSTGGLVGLILTMADQDASKIADAIALGRKRKSSDRKGITIHGGENLMHSLATTRAFVFRRAMNLRLSEVPSPGAGEKEAPYFKDENLVVRAMKIRPEGDANPEDTMEGVKRVNLPTRAGRAGSPTSTKRSFDDFTGDGKYREETLRSVVENMFCSDWSMNTMIEDTDPLDAPGPSAEDLAESLPTPSNRSRSTSPSKRPKHTPERDPNLSTTLPPPGKIRAPWPASVVRQLPRSKPCRIALSYIFTLHPQRGKFLPAKAIELGIKLGPSFSRLAAGETLTASNGNIVRPEDVMEPTKPGTGIAICDLPDASYVKDFLAREEWKDIEKVKVEIGCFFWILGAGVVTDERLKVFMKDMGHAKHVVSSLDVCPNTITFQGAAKSSTKLNLLDDGYFPMPHSSTEPPLPAEDHIQPAKPGLIFQIEPRWNLITESIEVPFSREKILEETEPAYIELAKAAREGNADKRGEDAPWKDVEVITLGTGSALPSKYRNVSSTLVRVPGAGSVIFDAGENTLGQLKRLYSPEELEETLRDLRALYISHLHADHHLGTVAVLKAWYNNGTHAHQQPERVMNVVAPWKFLVWLREYADVEDYGFSKIRFVSCEDLLRNNRSNPDNLTISLLPEVLSSASLADIQTSRAIHCMGSFTTSWTWRNGFKIAYSGDTRPTGGFVEIGRGATVLLHEATFDDELKAEAIAKKHSTTSEAIAAGKQMAAKAVVLTHFSQRYPKLPILSKADENSEMEVVVAFDLCRVRVGDVKRFGSFVPALKELYEEAGEAEEEEGESESEEEQEPEKPQAKAAGGNSNGAAAKKKKK